MPNTTKDAIVADAIENIIRRMFSYFNTSDAHISEYSMFHDLRRHASWFIVIFFGDSKELKQDLENGNCYQIHNFLRNELSADEITANTSCLISFEAGERPMEPHQINNLFQLLVHKADGQSKSANEGNIGTCGNCGHDFDSHQLFCNLDIEGAAPRDGWMICPKEDCFCFQTWSSNYIQQPEQ